MRSVLSGALVALLVALSVACAVPEATPSESSGVPQPQTSPTAVPPATATPADGRLVMTYYFYWYDAQTGAHLEPNLLNQHFPKGVSPSWRDVNWHRKEFADMTYAGIDVALPVYWGFDRPLDEWSTKGLDVMAQSWRQMAQRGERAPRIGMYFDTTIVEMRDLTTAANKEWFYANFKDFFRRIPREQWAVIGSRPIAFLFTSDTTSAFDQSTFDHVYQRFQADFGVRPYIVREKSWDEPILRWENGERVRDKARPIKTEATYVWAAALHGYRECCEVAAVGPGYDERGIPGRSGDRRDRENGNFYRRSFEAAVSAGRSMIAIETWNEFHENSGIAESLEYGRTYLDLTRELVAKFRAAKRQ